MDAIKKDQPIKVFGDGSQTRDFTYVGDVVATLTRAAHEKLSAPTPVNLAFGTRRSLNDVIGDLKTILNRDFDVEYLDTRVGDVKDSQAASEKLLGLFGDLEPTDFHTALRATADFIFSVDN